ncbi:hypothetical protein VE04_05747 [Pseudogymnoascus sp. 24MN13]|nr:hypothetical protein VE04_05747 [Pseudogymnoascus sp. 24MN13]
MKRTDGSTTGQVHRFRLGPEGLKLTSNKRANKRGKRSLNFTSPSIGSDKQPSAVRASPALQRLAGTSRLAVTRPRQRIIARENEENKLFPESSFRTAIGPPPDDSSQENVAELVRWTKEQQLTWLKTLLYPRGSSLYGVSSCAMDPFDAMSLNITPREQILIRDYFKDDSPLIPYCKAFFGLAVQDEAAFQADLNTANDLWQPPRFPAFESPLAVLPPTETRFCHQETTQFGVPSSIMPSTKPNIDTVIDELRTFATELAVVSRSLSPLNRSRIQISDEIQHMERRIFDLIHNPPAFKNPLDHSCAIAALIYLRANLRDNFCNFGVVKTSKLQIALQSVFELADLWKWGLDVRSREKLVWAVGFGAVSSDSGPEKPWFVRLFRDLCDTFELRRWERVKDIFRTVLWQDELDDEGIRLWEEVQKTRCG